MSRIEGMPEGWELVRIGVINHGEWTIDSSGSQQVGPTIEPTLKGAT